MDIFGILTMIGGLAMFLYGMNVMGAGLEKMSGGKLERILEKNPNNAPALNLYAYSLANRNIRLEDAQEYIARALALAPEDNSFIDTQAWIYFKQGKLQAAADLLAAIAPETVASDVEISYHIGAVLCAQGKTKEARPYLERARGKIKEADKLYKKLPAQK